MRFSFLARGRAVACVTVLVAVVGHARAAEPVADLALAVRESWSSHPSAAAVEHTLAAARARASAASRPLYNPSVELAVDDEGDERSTTAGIEWTLDVTGKRRARNAAGAARWTLAEAEAAQRRATFAQQWLHAWADRLAATERVQLGARRVALLQRFAALAQKQLAVGDIAPIERDLALLARDQAHAEYATLLGDAAAADEAWRALGGGDAVALPADAAPPDWNEAPALDVTTIPEVRVAIATVASTERQIGVSRSERRADPTLSVRGGRIEMGGASDNVLGIAISVPLFVRNDFRADVVAAQADAEAASAEGRRIELEATARADRALRTRRALHDAWSQWTASLATDRERRADLLERLWQAGELSTADYLVQLDQLLATALAGADLRGRLWRSHVDAQYATGRLDAWVGFESVASEVMP